MIDFNGLKLKNNQVCRVKFHTHFNDERTTLALFSEGDFFLFGSDCFDYEDLTVIESFDVFE